MVYTVYKTTNVVNGKFYIGVHKTSNPNDDYLGSGKLLKRAIKKYGVENFVKEILYKFENKIEAYAKEAELVTEDLIKSDLSYNITTGGKGGFYYINEQGLSVRNINKTNTKAFNRKAIQKLNWLRANDNQWVEHHRNQVTKGLRNSTKPKNSSFKKLNSDEEFQKKRKQAFSDIKHAQGTKNSQYGTKWVTDGVFNKKIKNEEPIPEGWRRGRVNNKRKV